MSNCTICTEKFNKSNRKVITCPYCKEQACQSCTRGYLLGLNSERPKCMHCSKEWTLDFICEVTPKVFHNNQYRNHRVKIYLETEETLLPSTQVLVEQTMIERSRYRDIDNLKSEEKTLIRSLNDVRERIRELRNATDYSTAFTPVTELTAVRIMCPCPKKNCRGFVKGENKKCGICNEKVCGKCHNIKTEGHICNIDDIESVNVIKKDSKPCPKCRVPIHKISGCSQMFCTLCHTRFDWRTGKEVSGEWFHNPHMVEWQRLNQNNTENNCINGLPSVDMFHRHLNTGGVKFTDINKIISCHTLINHINDIEMRVYPMRLDISDNTDLRIRYLLGEISKEEWFRNLKKRHKKREKDTEIHQIFAMFSQASTDIINHAMNSDDNTLLINSLEEIINYTNINMRKVKKRFSGKIPEISLAAWGDFNVISV